MRKFIVHADTIKIFVDEKDLVKYLGVEKGKGKMLEHIYIEEAEINIIKDGNALNYLDLYIQSTNAQNKIKSSLGDEFHEKLEKFKLMFLELAKDDPLKKRFIAHLETIPQEKKHISKLFSKYPGYLFSINDSIEWFKVILDVHNYKKIERSYIREIFYSNGASNFCNVVVKESAKKSFEVAKSMKTDKK